MATINLFNSKTVIEKLVNHYGLPAFLFNPIDQFTFIITDKNKKKIIKLLPIGQSIFNIDSTIQLFIPEDLWITKQDILASKISWLANYQNSYNARSAAVKKISSLDAENFLSKQHLMGFAKAAYHYALIIEKEIFCVASFSKGRKMNDLPITHRSFELIRFASKKFCTVNGGFSKLINIFCKEHHPGDIMTYIDPMFGTTNTLTTNGFKIISHTLPYNVYIHKKNYNRIYRLPDFIDDYYIFKNNGNIKLKKRLIE